MRFGNCPIELKKEWFLKIKPPFPVENSNRLWQNIFFFTLKEDGSINLEETFRTIIWEYPEAFDDKYIVLENIENAFESVSTVLKVYEETGFRVTDFDDFYWNRNINGITYTQEEFDNLIYGKVQYHSQIELASEEETKEEKET